MATLTSATRPESGLKDLASSQLIELLRGRNSHEVAGILSERQGESTTRLLTMKLAEVAGSTEQPFMVALTKTVAEHLKREVEAGRRNTSLAREAAGALLDVLEKTKPSEFEFRTKDGYWQNTLYHAVTALGGIVDEDRTMKALAALAVPVSQPGPGYSSEPWALRNDSVRMAALWAIGTSEHPLANEARRQNFYAWGNSPEAVQCGDLAAALIRQCDPKTVQAVKEGLLNEKTAFKASWCRDGWQPAHLAPRMFQTAAGALTPEQFDRLLEKYQDGPLREAVVSAMVLGNSPRHLAAAIAEMAPGSPAETAFTARFFQVNYRQHDPHLQLLIDSASALRAIEKNSGTPSPTMLHGARLYQSALVGRLADTPGMQVLVQRFEQLDSAGEYGAACRRNIANLLTTNLAWDSLSLAFLGSTAVTPETRLSIFEAAKGETIAHEVNVREAERQALEQVAAQKGTPTMMNRVLSRIDALGASSNGSFEPFLRSVFDITSRFPDGVHPVPVRQKALEIYGRHIKGSTKLLLDCLDGNDLELHAPAQRALKDQLMAAQEARGLNRDALHGLIEERLARNPKQAAYRLASYIDVLAARSEHAVAEGLGKWTRMDWSLCATLAAGIPSLLTSVIPGEDPIHQRRGALLQLMKLLNEAKYADATTSELARTLSSAYRAPYHSLELARAAVEHLGFAKDASQLSPIQRLKSRLSFGWHSRVLS